MKIEKKHIIGVIVGIIAIIIGFIFLRTEKIFYFIVVLSAVIATIPFLASLILERGRQREVEDKFLEFTRDLVENVKSGTPISKSIVNLKNRNYGKLTGYVQKLANQISLGITLTEALSNFAKDTRSPVILRAVKLISEAEKAGGQIDTILESVAKSVNQIENLKKERKSAVYSLIVQGYIIFMVFIIIMLVLEFKILPLTAGLGTVSVSNLQFTGKAVDAGSFSTPLLVMLIVQSLFTGLVIGKIAEGSLKDGIKHSFILIALTLLIKTGATAFLG